MLQIQGAGTRVTARPPNSILILRIGPELVERALRDQGTETHRVQGRFRYVDCGHGLAFIVTRDGDVVNLPALGFPLGALDLGGAPESSEIRLGGGDSLFVCSDGVLDVIPEIGATEVMRRLVAGDPSAAAIDHVTTASLGAGIPTDDVTLLPVRIHE